MKLTRRDKYLRKKYQITEATYKKMLAVFGGKCWICNTIPKKSVLNVDHDHKTEQVRGLLCFFCNKYVVGRSRAEHAWRYRRAADYLESIIDYRSIKCPPTRPDIKNIIDCIGKR